MFVGGRRGLICLDGFVVFVQCGFGFGFGFGFCYHHYDEAAVSSSVGADYWSAASASSS